VKLVLLADRVGPVGGLARYAMDLAAGLAEAGATVEVDAPRAGWARPAGVDCVVGLVRSAHHDVYRAGEGSHLGFMSRRYGWSRSVRVLAPRHRQLLRLDAQAVNKARIVVCNSAFCADEMMKRLDVPWRRIRIVRTGVDLRRFTPDKQRSRAALGLQPDQRVALFMARGFVRKGLANAARAFAMVAGPRDVFLVAGEDALATLRLGFVRRLVGTRLRWVGRVEDAERLLQASDALLHPTIYDPAAGVVLEALACGTPPITTSQDGSGEILPFQRLLVADPRDLQGLATALEWAWREDRSDELRKVATAWPVSRNVKGMMNVIEGLNG
jgi:UDP-glucose:(heptosyl)LPS alpha-1,3-glucosyltransferase